MNNDPYKILLVEDNDVDARVIQSALAKAGAGAFLVTRAVQLSEALARLRQQAFDLVLLDFMLPDSEGVATFQAVRQQAPDIAVVALTGLSDERIATQVVQEGAQDFLVKGQAPPEAIVRAMRYAIERHKLQKTQLQMAQGGKTGKMLGFIGASGGVGTTTVALNVAAALAQKSKNIVAAELTPFYGGFYDQLFYKMKAAALGNLSNLLALPTEKITQRELASRLIKLPTGLSLLLSPQRAEEFNEIDPDKAEAVVKALSFSGRHVILDLPNQPSATNRVAVKACDYVSVVVERAPASVAAGKMMVELLKFWGVTPGFIGVVVVTRQALAMPMELPEITNVLGCELIGVMPMAVEACVQAQRMAAPMVSGDPHNPAAAALIDIAERLGAEKVIGLRI